MLISYAAKEKIKSLPGVLALHLGLKDHRVSTQLVGTSTRICIEGFPRSGNGFALRCTVYVLSIPYSKLVHGNGVSMHVPSVAHHTHSTSNVVRAVRIGVPTFVLIRDPLECSLSLVAMENVRDMEDALRAYRGYYSRLLRLMNDILSCLSRHSLIGRRCL